MTSHVLILGAGFGGLELATRLSEFSDLVHTTLIDQSDAFVFGFEKFDVMFGHRTADEVRCYYQDFSKDGVEFRRERVASIDPATRHVETDRNSYDPDVLVVALGADLDPAGTPGFVEGGFEFYSLEGAERLRDVLASFDAGTVVVAVLGVPFKCPPAPYECALLLDDFLTERGTRDAVDIKMATPMELPIPVSQETSEAIIRALGERRIEYLPQTRVVALEPSKKIAKLADGGTIGYDLFLGIPIHRVPPVVEASGLTAGGTDGWAAVDPANLMTKYPNVYALGDNADAPIPRAGVFAEAAAVVVAEDIVSRLRRSPSPDRFDGAGICYIEFGGGLVGKVNANFLGGPSPIAPFTSPTLALAQEKAEFAASRRKRWFGR